MSNSLDTNQDRHFVRFDLGRNCLQRLLADDKSSKLTFSKNSFRSTIRVSNSLDTNQDRHFVCPDLG